MRAAPRSREDGSVTYDAIVIGLGGMGASALAHLASRNIEVLGLEQFELDHELGSSASPSRGFRKAYFTDPAYVALADRAQAAWRALEAEAQDELLAWTSALFVGPPEHPGVIGVGASCREHGLPHEVLDAPALRARFPALVPGDGDVGILELDAGVLLADRCNAAHVRRAVRHGAEVRAREAVTSIVPQADAVLVRTGRGEYLGRRVVVTAGPWLGDLLARSSCSPCGIEEALRVERQVELWFAPDAADDFAPAKLPLFHVGTRERGRAYYGIPRLDAKGVKVCRHYGGKTVTAGAIDRTVTKEDEEDVRGFLAEYMPGANGPLVASKVCMNTNTPDMHFVVGPHPGDARIVLAGGFSGHGYKFAPVVGEMLADLVQRGATDLPIALFSPARIGRGAASN